MEAQKNSYVIIALKNFLNGKVLTTILDAKNSNQYFNIIKNNGIELIEVWKPNKKNRGKHKERSLEMSLENITKAEDLLLRLKAKI
jgi:transcription initiation factor TFIIIB Brf1 subunit/transcription initiation factor TFIIB